MPLRLIATLAPDRVARSGRCDPAANAAATATPQVTRGTATLLKLRTQSRSACSAQVGTSADSCSSPASSTRTAATVWWTVRIPNNAALGVAHWSAQCGTFHRTGSWVVAAARGSKADSTPHVIVDKQGFSQRPASFGTGSTVSYGLLLRNTGTRGRRAALRARSTSRPRAGELIGTVTKSVALIPAGETFALGDSMGMRTQAPVTKLEVTLTVGAHEPRARIRCPHFANVRVFPRRRHGLDGRGRR